MAYVWYSARLPVAAVPLTPYPLLVLLLVALPLTAAAAEPRQVVESAVQDVLATMESPTLTPDVQRARVTARIAQEFDFVAMTRRTLATHWMDADAAQRARVTALFRQLLIDTYWRKIAAFRGEKIRFLGTDLRDGGSATVRTVIHTRHADIPIDYKLERSGERWMAYDVVIEQVSLVRNYRGTFLDTVRTHGIAGLIADLERRVEKAGSPG